MSSDPRTKDDDLEETIRIAMDRVRSQINTSIPCRVISSDGHTATLQPLIKGTFYDAKKGATSVDLPILQDVPLHFPGGGGMTMTFPVKAGDEAVVMFSQRSLDDWHSKGEDQQASDVRTHSLSDGIAMVGLRSNKNKLENHDSNNTQIRTIDGKTSISIGAGGIALKTDQPATLKSGNMLVTVSPTRVDLGGAGGSAVATQSGFSSKVFAII